MRKCSLCGLSESDYPFLFAADIEKCPVCGAEKDYIVPDEDEDMEEEDGL